MWAIGSSVKLSDTEKKLAEDIATWREQTSRQVGITDRKIGPQSNRDTDLMGAAGELGFCRMSNVYPNVSADSRPDFDVTIYSGVTVDIKTTTYPHGKLLVALSKKNSRVDLFALMTGEFPGPYVFRGFMSREELCTAEHVKNLGSGDCYAAEQHELEGIPAVIRVVEKKKAAGEL
jgi:hypothetical protein